mgnify:CR=1 FL=1
MKFLKGAGDKGAGNGEICEIPSAVNRPILTPDWYDRPLLGNLAGQGEFGSSYSTWP